MKSMPGTYVLILQASARDSVSIGRWGVLDIKRGYYLYVGSAFGPGGVKARVSRHCRADKSKRWHIDYLREYTAPVEIWYSHAAEHLEHTWATALIEMKDMLPISRFGCSDCSCDSHLFFSKSRPEVDKLAKATRHRVAVSACGAVMK